MKCRQCKRKIAKEQSFCDLCGAPVSRAHYPKSFFVSIILCFVLVSSLVGNIVLLKNNQSNLGNPSEKMLESGGFSSPEEAITEYAKAFRAGDIEGMISTFAVESYVKSFNLEEQLNIQRFYDINSEVTLLNNDSFAIQINQFTRSAALIRQIRNAYFVLIGANIDRANYAFGEDKKDEKIEEFLERFEYSEFDKTLSKMKIGSLLTEADFDFDEDYRAQLLSQYSYLDADDFRNVAIEIEFDGEDYYLFMFTAKIDGKWYNITTISMLGLVNGMDPWAGGLLKQ